MTTPSDPLYTSQWHFPLIGNIETIWNEFSGAGIRVGVYDDGVDYNHEDLDDNYDSSLHALDDFGNAIDPFPVGNDAHGTACAGLIGAESDNGVGGTGVASGVTLTGVNIFNSAIYGYVNASDSSGFMDVAGQAGTNFDISSNSWGSTPGFGSGQNINDASSFAGELHGVYGNISATGRGGLGTVIVQAAGNDTLDANGSGVNSSRYTITVAASDEFGNIQDYSNFGTSILVTAPAGAVTTDITGGSGYSSGDYTTTFGGTSAATPIVAGVTALMLEASENSLGWRDVQNILAISASETGSGYGNLASGFEVGEWGVNAATNWNGGGMAISGSYGFGMVDAYAAVRMAEVWHLFDAPQTSANEVMVSSNTWTGSQLLPDGDPTGIDFTLTVGADIAIEHIELSMGFNTTWAGDLSIIITTPDGTVIQAYYEGGLGVSFNDTWTFGIDHLLGETSAGTWTINVADNFGADANTITGLSMDIYGQTVDNNDVYHYTNDFLTLAGLDVSRLSLTDTNGGEDWLNLAAVGLGGTAGSLNLLTGVITGETGSGVETAQLLAAGSGIEHVVMGDTNDTVTGTNEDNSILGMRGLDVLYGGAGNDFLDGGAGIDTADYSDAGGRVAVFLARTPADLGSGQGIDTFVSIENVIGTDFDDRLVGDNNENMLVGGLGDDVLIGLGGADVLDGGIGDDELTGSGGDDTLLGGSGADQLFGLGGADTLDGGGGNDFIEGGLGVDTIIGGTGDDEIFGFFGVDTIDGGNGADNIRADGSGDIVNGGGGNDRVVGGNGRDTLWGGTGNDTLFGGGGSGAGDGLRDVFVFKSAANGGGGFDIIRDFEDTIDKIDLTESGYTTFADVLADASQVGANVEINFDFSGLLRINNFDIADLTAGDFIF